MENKKEQKKNIILSKYLPLLEGHYVIRSLEKHDLLNDKDHEECFIIKEGSVLARDKSGKTTTLNKGEPIGFAEAMVSRPYELKYICEVLFSCSSIYKINCFSKNKFFSINIHPL